MRRRQGGGARLPLGLRMENTREEVQHHLDQRGILLRADGNVEISRAGRVQLVPLQLRVGEEGGSDTPHTGRMIVSWGPDGNRLNLGEGHSTKTIDMATLVLSLVAWIEAYAARNTGEAERDARMAQAQADATRINLAFGLHEAAGAYAYASNTGRLRVQLAVALEPAQAEALLQHLIDTGIVRK